MRSRIMPSSRLSSLSAGRIALGYAVIALLWIAFSDAVVTHFSLPAALMTIKGTIFVLVTASLLYLIIRRLVQDTQITSTERKRTEEALRQSEAYLAEAQRLSHTGSFAFDVASNKYFYISDECFRIFELDPQQGFPTREAVSKLMHPEDWGRVAADFENLLREKVDTQSEFRIVLPGGAVKHIHAIRHPIVNDARDTTTVVGTAYLAEAQRLSHTGSWAFDVASDKYVYLSEEFRRIFELDAQQRVLLREALSRLIHPEDRATVKVAGDRTFCEKIDYDVEYRIVLPDGTVKHIHSIGHPVLNADGDVAEVVGTSVDITERKRDEEALRSANAYNRSLIEASLDPLVTIDPEGRITDVNAATEQVTGYTRSELIATDFSDYFTESKRFSGGIPAAGSTTWLHSLTPRAHPKESACNKAAPV